MGTLEILDAIAAAIREGMPEVKAVYADAVPTDCRRPAVLLELKENRREDAARGLIHYQETLLLTVILEEEGRGDASLRQLLSLKEKLLGLFSPGYLRVGDRAIGVKAAAGERDYDRASAGLQLEWFGDRPAQEQEPPAADSLTLRLEG